METGVGPIGARAAPAPNAGKIVRLRWIKPYAEATTQVCMGEIVRETAEYLVMKGVVLNFRKGDRQAKRDEERVHWIPWAQIAIVDEMPTDLKWRQTEFFVDEAGQIAFNR